jgi:hypothetical protein
MTPAEYLAAFDALLAAGDDRAALDLAARFGPEIHPRLSVDEFDSLMGALEGCALAVSLETMPTQPAQRPG